MEVDIYGIFINQYCKVVLVINNSTFIYSAYIIDYNSETITFIDKFKKPYTYSSKLITELKLHEENR